MTFDSFINNRVSAVGASTSAVGLQAKTAGRGVSASNSSALPGIKPVPKGAGTGILSKIPTKVMVRICLGLVVFGFLLLASLRTTSFADARADMRQQRAARQYEANVYAPREAAPRKELPSYGFFGSIFCRGRSEGFGCR